MHTDTGSNPLPSLSHPSDTSCAPLKSLDHANTCHAQDTTRKHETPAQQELLQGADASQIQFRIRRHARKIPTRWVATGFPRWIVLTFRAQATFTRPLPYGMFGLMASIASTMHTYDKRCFHACCVEEHLILCIQLLGLSYRCTGVFKARLYSRHR